MHLKPPWSKVGWDPCAPPQIFLLELPFSCNCLCAHPFATTPCKHSAPWVLARLGVPMEPRPPRSRGSAPRGLSGPSRCVAADVADLPEVFIDVRAGSCWGARSLPAAFHGA